MTRQPAKLGDNYSMPISISCTCKANKIRFPVYRHPESNQRVRAGAWLLLLITKTSIFLVSLQLQGVANQSQMRIQKI